MNIASLIRTVSILTVTVAAQLSAVEPGNAGRNEFRFGPSFGFNIKTRFREAAATPIPATPAAGALVDRNYTDGYVRVDSSGNTGNQTWNWGYRDNSQYDAEAATLDLHHYAINSESAPSETDEPSYGFELAWLRRLGDCANGFLSMEVAIGYSRLEITDRSTHPVNATVTTDAYPLGTVIPPFAPYEGSFAGPGALLTVAPTRQTVTGAGMLSGLREVTADLYNLRLGPVLTVPVGETVRFELGAGVSVALVDHDFTFSEGLAVNGISATRSGRGGDTDTLLGPYVRGAVSVALTPSWSVFAGVQYQRLSNLIEETGAGKTMELDFRQAIFTTVGVSISF